MELRDGTRVWPHLILKEQQLWTKTEKQSGVKIKIETGKGPIDLRYEKSTTTKKTFYDISSNSILTKWRKIEDVKYRSYNKKNRTLTIPDETRTIDAKWKLSLDKKNVETQTEEEKEKTKKDAETQTFWQVLDTMKPTKKPKIQEPRLITEAIKDGNKTIKPPIIAKATRSKLNTYYIETTDKKRPKDIQIRGITLTPLWSISSRFPEIYKILSAANGNGGWKQMEAARQIEILKDNPKPEIWRHVLKNIDNPRPGRRTLITH